MRLRIATYNINSIRIRLNELKKLVDDARPHILCLQETKVPDELFPGDAVKKLGFKEIHFSGQKGYNGVAILSNVPLTDINAFDLATTGHKRHIAAKMKDGTEIHNFYVPAGGDIPDRRLNDKFDMKLRFMDAMTEWASGHRKKKKRIVAVGDLNIAPLEHDVWSHKQLLKVVSHTPVETDAMERFRKSLGWVDSARHFVPHDQKLYSWWSYRNQDWRKSDRGRRLDHIWVTPEMAPSLISSRVLKDARDWKMASDHVPVVTELRFRFISGLAQPAALSTQNFNDN